MPAELAQATAQVIRALPRSTMTKAIGWLAERNVPSAARPWLLGGLARAFRMDMGEAEHGVSAYPTFQDLFCRRLAEGTRPCAGDDRALVSPVDGRLVEAGPVGLAATFLVKARSYSVATLLGDAQEAERYIGGTYAIFYLSPRDYHRMHSPVQARVRGYRWIRGDFWPVNDLVPYLPDVYGDNERIVTYLEATGGRVAMVKVAALGVGYISLGYLGEPAGRRVARDGRPVVREFEPAESPELGVGEEMAAFGLGSTVVLLFEPGHVQLREERIGSAVRVGEPLGSLVSK